LQFATRLEAKLDLIANGASYPTVLSNSGDGGKPQTRGAANDLQNIWYGVNPGYRLQIAGKNVFHYTCPSPGIQLIILDMRFRAVNGPARLQFPTAKA
jgi:hypothetical protein